MNLLLIRHGPSRAEPDLPASQWALTAAGEAECARFALDRLSPYRPTRFVTSQEPKARRTGQIMAAALGNLPCAAAPDLHEHLRERAPWFDSVSEFQAAVTHLFAEPDTVVFGEESANQTRRRFHHAVTSLVSRYPDETLAIVTHGTALSLFVAHYNEIDVAAFWQRLTMPACTILSLPSYQLTQTLYAP